MLDVLDSTDVVSYTQDLAVVWEVVLGVMGIAFVISILYMVFLRYCVGVALWMSIVLIITFFILFGVFLYWTSQNEYE